MHKFFVLAALALAGGLFGGCASRRMVDLDAQHPAVRYNDQGIYFADQAVSPYEVAGILQDYDIPRDRVIHIRVDPGTQDLRGARYLIGILARAGYPRAVLVTERHSEAINLGKKKKSAELRATRADGGTMSTTERPQAIHYKKGGR